MTKDQIKSSTSMTDVLSRYGIRVTRNGFCRCFHHNDKHESMKVYKDSVHCYSCGFDADVFGVVAEINNVSFKEAFLILGGEYEKDKEKAREIARRAQEERQRREKQEQEEKQRKQLLLARMSAESVMLAQYEPLSVAWCDAYTEWQRDMYTFCEMSNIPFYDNNGRKRGG